MHPEMFILRRSQTGGSPTRHEVLVWGGERNRRSLWSEKGPPTDGQQRGCVLSIQGDHGGDSRPGVRPGGETAKGANGRSSEGGLQPRRRRPDSVQGSHVPA